MKSPIPYFGGKMSLANRISDLLPAHTSYIEPFAGGLSVLLAKEPVAMEVVNDLDGNLMNFWRVLRDQPDELLWALDCTPHSRAEFEASADMTVDDIERARRVFVTLTQGRSARPDSSGWRFNASPGIDASLAIPRYLDRYRDRLLPASERLRSVTLENRDALEVIRLYGRPGALLYVDPPYLAQTRTSKNVYSFEMGQSHAAMLEALNEVDCSVVLSGYADASYDRALADWERLELRSRTQRASRVEVVWIKNVTIAAAA